MQLTNIGGYGEGGKERESSPCNFNGTCSFNNGLDVASGENTLQTYHLCFIEEEERIWVDFLFVLLR